MNELQVTDWPVYEYFEDIGADGNGLRWRCIKNGCVLRHGILHFWRNFAYDCYNGLTWMGLPQTDEIYLSISTPSRPVCVQVFEFVVVTFDPTFVIDRRYGDPTIYFLRHDSPVLFEIADMLQGVTR